MNATTSPGTTRHDHRRRGRPAHGRPPLRTAFLAMLSAAVLVLGLTACASSPSKSPTTVVATATPKIENGVQVFDVVGTTSLQFSPSTLIAKPGKITVNLSVENGSPLHNFVVDGIPGARTDFAMAGQPRSVTFTVSTPGSYRFVCTIHPSMQGTLTVG